MSKEVRVNAELIEESQSSTYLPSRGTKSAYLAVFISHKVKNGIQRFLVQDKKDYSGL